MQTPNIHLIQDERMDLIALLALNIWQVEISSLPLCKRYLDSLVHLHFRPVRHIESNHRPARLVSKNFYVPLFQMGPP